MGIFLNNIPDLRTDFIEAYGEVYYDGESHWITLLTYDFVHGNDFVSNDIASIRQKFNKQGLLRFDDFLYLMSRAVERGSREQKLALLNAYPNLNRIVSNVETISKYSEKERGSVGLDSCRDDLAFELAQLNQAYEDKFSFPLIIAMKGLRDRPDAIEYIIQAFYDRLKNDQNTEFDTSLEQAHRIAYFRLEDIANTLD